MTIKTPFFEQLRRLVIIPAQKRLGLDCSSSRNLLLGTAAQESGGRTIAQIGGGPALSYWDIEPATANWVWSAVLDRYPTLYSRLCSLSSPGLSLEEQLSGNALLAAGTCRLRYYLAPDKLPLANDWQALGAYWKQFYNTPKGAGTVAEFVANAEALIGAPPDVA